MPFRRVILLCLLLGAQPAAAAGQSGIAWETMGVPAEDVELRGEAARLKVQLPGVRETAAVVETADGRTMVLLRRPGAGNDRLLAPDEFARVFHRYHSGRGWLDVLFNITGPVGIAWVVLGLAGQAVFAGRMLIQWVASERSRRSVVPVAFWWMSLIGASMLLVYFIWRRDIVGVLGQATGWAIYLRNLVLIRRSRGS